MIFVHVWEVLEDHLLNTRYQGVSELTNPSKYDFCSCLGDPGGPFAEHKVPKCQRFKTMETSSQWRHMYNKEKMTSSSYMGHDVKKKNNLGYLGGPGNAWGRTSIIGLDLSHIGDICTTRYI